jgi:hypothetical protein
MFPREVAYDVGNGIITKTVRNQEQLDEIRQWVEMSHGSIIGE